MKSAALRALFIVISVLALAALACGSGATSATVDVATLVPASPTAADAPSPTPAGAPVATDVPPTATPLPTGAPAPTSTSQPTPTAAPPTATPSPTSAPVLEPIVLLELEGQGQQVTDNYEWPACFKGVFYWTVKRNSFDAASLILRLHNVATENPGTVVNEMGMDLSGDLSGSALQVLLGGSYYLSTDNTDEPWSLRIECQDGQAPAAEGLNLEGIGNVVSENFRLSHCQKSVFSWTVEPNSFGAAALIVHLAHVEAQRGVTLVNDMDMDLTDTYTGQALQAVDAGTYFIVTENTTGPWTIHWECRD